MSVSVTNLDINFFTDEELTVPHFDIGWSGTAHDINSLASANELMTNVDPSGMVIGNTANPAKYYLNLTHVRSIYMKSPNLSSFNTIGCNGESSIITQKSCEC